MSEYEHGSEEVTEEQVKKYYWDNPVFHEGRLWGRAERDAEITHEADLNEHAKGYQSGQEDLYVFANGMAEEWHSLKVVNDSQMLRLKELLHEMEKIVYFTGKGDE